MGRRDVRYEAENGDKKGNLQKTQKSNQEAEDYYAW